MRPEVRQRHPPRQAARQHLQVLHLEPHAQPVQDSSRRTAQAQRDLRQFLRLVQDEHTLQRRSGQEPALGKQGPRQIRHGGQAAEGVETLRLGEPAPPAVDVRRQKIHIERASQDHRS